MAAQTEDDEQFDASQYAFFGGDISQEVELGGLDEEDDIALIDALEEDERILLPSSEKEEVEGPLEISMISNSLMNLEVSSSHDPEVDSEVFHNMHRVLEILSPRQRAEAESRFGRMPFPMARPHSSVPMQATMFHDGRQRAEVSEANVLPPYGHHFPLPIRGPQPFSQFGGRHGFIRMPPNWPLMPPSSIQRGISRGFVHQQELVQQHPPFRLPPEVLMQTHFGQVRPPFINAGHALFSHIPSVPPDYFSANGNGRVMHHDYQLQNRQAMGPYQQGGHGSSNPPNRNTTQQHFRSKYMTSEEIESIARIQRAATHGTDPYIDDYYHQAMRAKVASGSSQGRHHFAPRQLRDFSSHRCSQTLRPTFVPVDGLGKVPFSSFRSPRPLLEVDDLVVRSGAASNLKSSQGPLEQEPLLAARIAIEEGLCLLLDVDDIDRYLLASQPPDGGIQLRWRRQVMLEELAASLELVEPLNLEDNRLTEKNGQVMEAEPTDLVFLHFATLPKGLKLMSRFLELLPQGSPLVDSFCMAVFRHLHFLFSVPRKDLGAVAATSNLARRVASCAAQMNLRTLTACIGAVVSSSEHPPLRPLGSASGDGASLILRSSLDQATNLLTDRSFTISLQERKNWQATFDSFFLVLYRYCTDTFDRILHTMAMSSPSESAPSNNESAADKMTKEMPIELLRASLPHMNEHQRKTLLDFTQRSVAKGAQGGHTVRHDRNSDEV